MSRGRPHQLPLTIEALGELLNPLVEIRADSECWIWTGPHNPNGAPRILLRFKNRRASYSTSVSRLMYQYIYDCPDVKDLPRFRSCPASRSCVNPAHTVYASNQDKSLGETCGRGHELTPMTTKRTDDGRLVCLICRRGGYGKRPLPPPDWEEKARAIVAKTWGEDRTLPDLSRESPDPETERTRKARSKATQSQWAKRSKQDRRAQSQLMRDARYTEHIDAAHFDRILAHLHSYSAMRIRCDSREAERVRTKLRKALAKEDLRLGSSYDNEKKMLHVYVKIPETEKSIP